MIEDMKIDENLALFFGLFLFTGKGKRMNVFMFNLEAYVAGLYVLFINFNYHIHD